MTFERFLALFFGLYTTVLVVYLFSEAAALILAVVASLFLATLAIIAEIFS